jgi:hypothetical protein
VLALASYHSIGSTYNDIFDAFRLALKFYRYEETG